MDLRNHAKRSLRPILRPAWHSIWLRIEARLQPSLHRIETRQQASLAQIEARQHAALVRIEAIEAGWRQHLPAFLNAVSTVGAFGHELARLRREFETEVAALSQEVRAVAEQIESVRNEDGDPEARVLSPEMVARAAIEGMRLNLGCGHVPWGGYVNVDQRDLPGVDIVGEVGDLPIMADSVREIASNHLLEHFPQAELRSRLLPYWRGLLVSGGTFRAVVPDGEAMLAGLAAGTYTFEQFRAALFGAQERGGDIHRNMFLPQSLQDLLEEAGFTQVEIPAKGRRNGVCFEFEIRAVRP